MKQMPDDQTAFFQRLRLCAERSGWLVGGKYHGLVTALSKAGLNLTPDEVRRWFLGDAVPRTSFMGHLSALLRVNPQWLESGTGDPLSCVPPKPLLSGPECSRIPVLTPELCYDWCNYLPVPDNLPRLTVYRLCHPRTFAYLIRQRKSAGRMRPQRHVIVSPLESNNVEGEAPLTVVCDQRKFHVGQLEQLGTTQFLVRPGSGKPPLRLSFSHQLAGFVDPDFAQCVPVIPGERDLAVRENTG